MTFYALVILQNLDRKKSPWLLLHRKFLHTFLWWIYCSCSEEFRHSGGGSVLTTACPAHQIQKVSSWSLYQVRFQLLFPSLPENLGFFPCKFWQSACDTSNIRNPLAFQEKANHLDGAAPLRKQWREHILLCIPFTLRHVTSQAPPEFHSSQNSARPPTHSLANWLTQKSSREGAATAGRKKPAQLAEQHGVGRSCRRGTKRVSYGLPWNEQCNGSRTQRSWEERTGKKEHTEGISFLLLPQLTPLNFLPPPGSPVSKNNLYKSKNCRGREP